MNLIHGEFQDEISKIDTQGFEIFEIKAKKKLDVKDLDFAIDTMWYNIEDGQLTNQGNKWTSLDSSGYLVAPKYDVDNVKFSQMSAQSDSRTTRILTEAQNVLKMLPELPER